MHKYMILVEVPSTAPLFGVDGLNTNRKVKCVGFIKSNFQAYPNLNRFLNKNKSRLQNAIVNPREVPEGLRV